MITSYTDSVLDALAGITSTFDELFDATSAYGLIVDEVDEKMRDINITPMADRIAAAPNRILHIEAVTGDDKIVTEIGGAYGLATVGVASAILKVDMSWSDVGISHWAGNYAEDWILTPLTTETGVSSKYGRAANAIPWILDFVKVRLLSPVRKQSEENMDFVSKFRALTANARYAKPGALAYYDNQLAIVLALAVFDYRHARDFPFLWKSEGGCGGFPPFSSVHTASNSLYHFDSGRATPAIHGILAESVALHNGRITIGETKFLRAVHMAMYNPSEWLKYLSALSRFKEAGLSEADIDERLKEMTEDDIIPEELKAKMYVVSPDSTYLGGVISALRHSRMIMTELDVMAHMQGIVRAENLKGTTPFREILDQQKTETKEMKRKRLSLLSQGHARDTEAEKKMASAPTPGSSESVKLFSAYLSMGDRLRVSSFAHQGVIRFFKTADVLDHFDVFARRQFIESLDEVKISNLETPEFKPGTIRRMKDHRATSKFINELPFSDEALLEGLPRQYGTGDAVVLGTMHNLLGDGRDPDGEIFIIVSADRGLASYAGKMAPHVFYVRPTEYLSWTLSVEKKLATKSKWIKNTIRSTRVRFPDLLNNGKLEYLPKRIVENIKAKIPHPDRPRGLHFLFDSANVVKSLGRYTILGGEVSEIVSGWVRPEDRAKLYFDEIGEIQRAIKVRVKERRRKALSGPWEPDSIFE